MGRLRVQSKFQPTGVCQESVPVSRLLSQSVRRILAWAPKCQHFEHSSLTTTRI